MNDARLRAFLRGRWLCVTLVVVMPFLAVLYGRLLALLVDYLSPPPHRRLTLVIHYLGAFLRLVLQPAFAWALVVGLLLVVWRDPLWTLLRGLAARLVLWEFGPKGNKMEFLGEREAWTPKPAADTKKDATP